MNAETEKFINAVNDVAKSYRRLLPPAIHTSQFHHSLLNDENWTKQKILANYKRELMEKWNFVDELESEAGVNLKKVDFWEVMEYFKTLKIDG